jgi:hypothetical protein
MKNQKDTNETTNKGGAPEGNNNAGKGSQLSALLRAALNSNDRLKMRQGVDAVADAFADGERWAVEFVFDRLEGKAIVKQELSTADGSSFPLGLTVNFVKPDDTTED